MKMTNEQAEQKLKKLYEIKNIKIGNKKVSYAIARNIRKLEDELKEYTEEKTKVIEKIGKKVDNNYRIAREDYETDEEFLSVIQKYENEMKEISQLEIEVDIMNTSIENFSDEVSASTLYDLDFMIIE